MNPFPCNSCGKCCRNVHLNIEIDYLDRGDGICRHLEQKTNLCLIYEDRPLICRVEDYYKKHLTEVYEWQDFVNINLAACEQLQDVKNNYG